MNMADGIFNQGFDSIEDDSILGQGFSNVPQQGPRHTGGTYNFNVDAVSMVPLFSAALGNVSTKTYTFNGSHDRKLSIAELNSVNCIQYTSCYVKSLKLSASKGGLLKADTELFSLHPQTRTTVGSFPSITVPGLPFNFHEAGGTNGYIRVGDQVDALSSADNIKIDNLNIEMTCGFDELYANESDLATPQALGPLTPLWGMVRPSVKMSFKIPKFVIATFLTAQENHTGMQADIYFYKSATSTLRIRIPNFIIKADLTSEDLTGMNIECSIGRNGISTSYVNSFMTINSPIEITVVNA
jgi:hypothetical protein